MTLSASAQSWWGKDKRVKGNGNITIETRKTSDYDGVSVGGFFDVILVKGKEGKIKIEGEEKAHQSALREIKEETGLIPIQLWVAPTINSFYEPKDEYICLLPVFASRVEGETIVILSEEHTEYKWVGKDDAKKLLAWPGQRDAVDIIGDYFLNEKSFFHFVEIKVE